MLQVKWSGGAFLFSDFPNLSYSKTVFPHDCCCETRAKDCRNNLSEDKELDWKEEPALTLKLLSLSLPLCFVERYLLLYCIKDMRFPVSDCRYEELDWFSNHYLVRKASVPQYSRSLPSDNVTSSWLAFGTKNLSDVSVYVLLVCCMLSRVVCAIFEVFNFTWIIFT